MARFLPGTIACVIILSLSAGAAAAADAISLTITSPRLSTRVSGMVIFSATADSVPSGGVEFLVDGSPVCGPILAEPYRLPWNSVLVYNGLHTVQAMARDASGEAAGTSRVATFTVANGSGSLHLASPNLRYTYSGDVYISVQLDVPTGYDLDVSTMYLLDGEQLGVTWGVPPAPVTFDTTTVANGPHDLMVVTEGSDRNTQASVPIGMFRGTLMVDNGHAVQAVLPRFSDIILAPGESDALPVRLLYTDGTQETLTRHVSYSCADTSIATVDANGLVTAISEGVTRITINAYAKAATTRVIVNTLTGLPHFGRGGQLLTSYDPSHSFFMRAMFNLGANDLSSTPGLKQLVQAAGVNTLTSGFYNNPADSHQTTFEGWKSGWQYWFDNFVAPPITEGFSFCFTGDDICRFAYERDNTLTNPWAPDAIRLAFSTIRDTGRAACVEMVDEASMLGDPPPDWINQVMAIINDVPNRTPVSWPVLGISGTSTAANWMGDPAISDYTSNYWDVIAVRRAYPDGSASLPQVRQGLDRAVVKRYPYMQRNRPMLLLTSLCGNWYMKDPVGSDLTKDQYIELAWQAPSVQQSVQIMYGAVMGAAGVRSYAYDGMWQRQRDNGDYGRYQIGASPVGAGSDRWQSAASAYNLIAHLEPYLLQKQISAACIGPAIVSGARRGTDGSLLLATNFSEISQSATVDLQPYRSEANSVTRYRLTAATLVTESIPDVPIDSVTFASGESIIWLIKPLASGGPDATPPAVRFIAPAPDSVLSADSGSSAVQVQIEASDDVGVTNVEFFVDGTSTGTAAQAPYSFTWDASTVKENIWHNLSARASDAAGNVSIARIAVRPTTLLQKLYKYWTLQISASDGSGSTSPGAGSHLFGYDQSCEATATPSVGWRFDHWLGTAVAGDSNTNPIIVENGTDGEVKTLQPVFVHALPGDVNNDCKVNIIDLIFVRNRLNADTSTEDNQWADVNGDGRINIIDLIAVRNRLNTRCE